MSEPWLRALSNSDLAPFSPDAPSSESGSREPGGGGGGGSGGPPAGGGGGPESKKIEINCQSLKKVKYFAYQREQHLT